MAKFAVYEIGPEIESALEIFGLVVKVAHHRLRYRLHVFRDCTRQ